jgi:hypothetical protein
VDEIKNHPFFAGVNWKTLLEKPGIFMPRPTDQYDTGYFWGTDRRAICILRMCLLLLLTRCWLLLATATTDRTDLYGNSGSMGSFQGGSVKSDGQHSSVSPSAIPMNDQIKAMNSFGRFSFTNIPFLLERGLDEATRSISSLTESGDSEDTVRCSFPPHKRCASRDGTDSWPSRLCFPCAARPFAVGE